MSTNEDLIIAEALNLIRTAVESQDWELVCEAYASITGEKLDLPKPKTPPHSRLDNIRSLMNKKTKPIKDKNRSKEKVKTEVLSDERKDWDSMSVDDIKIELIVSGAIEAEFMKMSSKKELVKYANDFETKLLTVKKTTVPVKPRSKFARGEVEIIAAPEIDGEKIANARLRATNPRGPAIKRNTELKAIEDKETEGSFSFNPNPQKRKKNN